MKHFITGGVVGLVACLTIGGLGFVWGVTLTKNSECAAPVAAASAPK